MKQETPRDRYHTRSQKAVNASSWSVGIRIVMVVFKATWLLTCRWTPPQLNPLRLLVLRGFGTKISGKPYVASSCIIRHPWLLTLEDRATLAPGSEVYNLGHVTLKSRCTIAQYTYLCGGTHDLSLELLPLIVAPIEVGADAFIGARAFVMPGVVIGEGAVVGAAAVVTNDIEPWKIVAGNPARVIGDRSFEGRQST